MNEALPPDSLLGMRIAGHSVSKLLNAENSCRWFEVISDTGRKAILYVYDSPYFRDANRHRVHAFITSLDETVETPNGRVTICADIGEYRIMMPLALRQLLTEDQTSPTEIVGYTIERVLGCGFKGVTYEARRKNGPATPYALKVTIAEEYDGRTFLPEVDRMVEVAIKDRDHFPQVHDCGEWTFSHHDQSYRLVYFVEDMISGQTLEKLLSTSSEKLDASFLYDFIQETLAAVATLQASNLMHDDLHAGNVMLHDPPSGRSRPYLIDFGSAKPRGETKKKRDDIRNLASQIAAIANKVQQSPIARTIHDEHILKACESLLAVISDDDPLRRPNDAMELISIFDRSFSHGAVRQELTHPFDFGNAEEVMDNSLLYSLAAKSFPWRDQIEASSHLLVIGPRGCGKTTVFRSMSFVCLADAGQVDTALEKTYLGLYVSCNKEFRQRFSAIDRSLLERSHDEIRHYFNMVVLREFTSVLVALNKAHRVSETDLKAVTSFINEHCSSLLPNNQITDVQNLEARVTRAVQIARMALWNGVKNDDCTEQGFVADLAELIATRLSSLSGKTLYIFVDDYTEGKVPKEVQQALNHILFVPNSAYKCKISSEVFGVMHDDVFGSFLDQDREYKEWNLGTLYCLNLPPKEQKAFLKEIVDNRLDICGYKGRVDTVIGDSRYAAGTLEKALKYEYTLRKERQLEHSDKPPLIAEKNANAAVDNAGAMAYYHGWDTICNLCTGDVSNILELLNRMFKECSVKKDSNTIVHPDHQDSVITSYSRQYISKIKGIPKYGEKLFDIVDAFGHMSQRLLEEYPPVSHGENREEPYRLIRIELDEAGRQAGVGNGISEQGSEALQIWKLLQRYCVFIDADEGRSRRHTLSSRVILRRIFCPAFKIGLVNSESFTLSQSDWNAFVADPRSRAEQYARATIERATRKRGVVSDRQQSFSFENKGKAQ